MTLSVLDTETGGGERTVKDGQKQKTIELQQGNERCLAFKTCNSGARAKHSNEHQIVWKDRAGIDL